MTAVKSVRHIIDDIITALEEGLNGVWALFAEAPDAVVMQREGGYEVVLFGKFMRIRLTTDEGFSVKHVEVEYD